MHLPDGIYWLIGLPVAVYAIIILALYLINKRQRSNRLHETDYPTVSIVIAVRNEELTIGPLLYALQNQQYPGHLLEIIVVDDHSNDNTAAVVSAFNNVRLLTLSDNYGKKHCISYGLQFAGGNIIMFTDADCLPAKEWVSSIVSNFKDPNVKMVLGPVKLQFDGLFTQIQALEFAGLMSITRLTARAGFPLMSNGANMALRKNVLDALPSNYINHRFASGDDMFTLINIRKIFGRKSVCFSEDKNSIIQTPAVKKLSGFIDQRRRWISKSSGLKSNYHFLSGILIGSCNLSLLVLLFLSAIMHKAFILWLIAFTLKLLIEFPLMWKACRFNKNTVLIRWLPVLQFVYPWYLGFIWISSQIPGQKWKGRSI